MSSRTRVAGAMLLALTLVATGTLPAAGADLTPPNPPRWVDVETEPLSSSSRWHAVEMDASGNAVVAGRIQHDHGWRGATAELVAGSWSPKGELRWRSTLRSGLYERLVGVAASWDRSRLFVLGEREGSHAAPRTGWAAAVDTATGQVLWQVTDATWHVSGLAVSGDGETVVVGLGPSLAAGVVGLDADTGATRWERSFDTADFEWPPALVAAEGRPGVLAVFRRVLKSTAPDKEKLEFVELDGDGSILWATTVTTTSNDLLVAASTDGRRAGVVSSTMWPTPDRWLGWMVDRDDGRVEALPRLVEDPPVRADPTDATFTGDGTAFVVSGIERTQRRAITTTAYEATTRDVRWHHRHEGASWVVTADPGWGPRWWDPPVSSVAANGSSSTVVVGAATIPWSNALTVDGVRVPAGASAGRTPILFGIDDRTGATRWSQLGLSTTSFTDRSPTGCRGCPVTHPTGQGEWLDVALGPDGERLVAAGWASRAADVLIVSGSNVWPRSADAGVVAGHCSDPTGCLPGP